MKAQYLYHVRSCDGVTIELTEDLAAARKIVAEERAALFKLNTATGHMVRTV